MPTGHVFWTGVQRPIDLIEPGGNDLPSSQLDWKRGEIDNTEVYFEKGKIVGRQGRRLWSAE